MVAAAFPGPRTPDPVGLRPDLASPRLDPRRRRSGRSVGGRWPTGRRSEEADVDAVGEAATAARGREAAAAVDAVSEAAVARGREVATAVRSGREAAALVQGDAAAALRAPTSKIAAVCAGASLVFGGAGGLSAYRSAVPWGRWRIGGGRMVATAIRDISVVVLVRW
ncbi:hypothetical protein EJB05_02478, partial [Eragrostis curvula]